MILRNSLYILSTLFGVGILLLLIINPIIQGYIAPALLSSANAEITEQISGNFAFIIFTLNTIPYILFFTSFIYLLLIIFRKEEVSQYE